MSHIEQKIDYGKLLPYRPYDIWMSVKNNNHHKQSVILIGHFPIHMVTT